MSREIYDFQRGQVVGRREPPPSVTECSEVPLGVQGRFRGTVEEGEVHTFEPYLIIGKAVKADAEGVRVLADYGGKCDAMEHFIPESEFVSFEPDAA